ncbi:hypothetical protein [Streptomyces sp. NPDC005302]|uniref:hypothetical protein n=1 Tax=Streptomyces sp. NPDC005302 TaxID=3154675 RepID=UPI0033A7F7C3
MSITSDDVIRTLREVVDEQPDHVYQRPADMDGSEPCLYVHTDETGAQVPGCVVGHVVSRLGVSLSNVADHEGTNASGLLEVLRISVGDDTAEFLDTVQGHQDLGFSWREALMRADEEKAGTEL